MPISCTTRTYRRSGYPAFDCHGYVGGTSGAPWLSGVPGREGVVTGVIGGLQEGGDVERTSYSPAFGADIMRLYRRAAGAG